MRGRYAVIARLRLQVAAFASNPAAVNLENNIVVDLQDHPQRDEVDVDWFFDVESNAFHIDGEVSYPEPSEEEAPAPTQLDNIEQVQLTMMEAMADQYEETQERELTNMDVLATMYEEILSIKGEE